MGRPLKIQKYASNAGAAGAAVGIDIGFPDFASLTNPVINSADTLNTTQYLGVVGGVSNTATSATNPIIKCRAFITGTAAEGDAKIIRQKGSRKYLVATDASVADEDLIVGVSYRITSVGTTDWVSVGGPSNAAVGTIFLCTADVGAGTGTAQAVGVCILEDEADASLTEGNMNITFSVGDSTVTTISKLTNKWLLDFTGGSGFTPAEVINNVRYASNFFTDEGTVIKSGTAQTTVTLGQVESATS